MSLLSRLFGSGGKSPEPPLEHNGFSIYVEPEAAAGGYRISARIEKEVGGETKAHRMIRADTCNSIDEARDLTLAKAKILIEQQGESIFG